MNIATLYVQNSKRLPDTSVVMATLSFHNFCMHIMRSGIKAANVRH